MRKALMGFILAATVMTPIAAEAQRGHRGGGDGNRGAHSRGQNGGDNARAARAESRSESRPVQNESPPAPPPAPRAARQNPQAAPPQRSGGGNNWRGNTNNSGANNGANRGGNRGGRNQPSVYPQAWQGNANDPRLQHYRNLERRNQNSAADRRGDRDRDGRNWRGDRNDRNVRDGRRGERRNWRNDWNRGWRNDNRYNWNHWRSRNRHVYHLSPYYSPYRNWSYRRFSIGLFLDSLFYNQRYWIGDPWQYRLPPAPYGTQWVRYYNDVLLVDIYTGEVVDAIYDFFW